MTKWAHFLTVRHGHPGFQGRVVVRCSEVSSRVSSQCHVFLTYTRPNAMRSFLDKSESYSHEKEICNYLHGRLRSDQRRVQCRACLGTVE